MAADWLKLKREYLQTGVSLRKLAEKHGIGRSGLKKVAAREGWTAMRRAAAPAGKKSAGHTPARDEKPKAKAGHKPVTQQKIKPKPKPKPAGTVPLPALAPPDAAAERLAKIQAISDRLTAQLDRAACELNQQVIKHRRRTREVTYGEDEAKGKPVEETVEEHEQLEFVDGPVSCADLQRLSSTLKALHEITRHDNGDGESVDKLEELMRKLDKEAGKEEP